MLAILQIVEEVMALVASRRARSRAQGKRKSRSRFRVFLYKGAVPFWGDLKGDPNLESYSHA